MFKYISALSGKVPLGFKMSGIRRQETGKLGLAI